MGGGAFDPAKSLELGADGGGMAYLGVAWSHEGIELVLVEHEDPIEENLVTHFETPAAFFAYLEEYRDPGEGDGPDLAALRAATDD